MAEVINLYEYYHQCTGCNGIEWYIQYTHDCVEIKQIMCTNPDCTMVIENPGVFTETKINFEPDFELS